MGMTDGTLNGTEKVLIYDTDTPRPRSVSFFNGDSAAVTLRLYKSYNGTSGIVNRTLMSVRIATLGTFVWDGSEFPKLEVGAYVRADQAVAPGTDISWTHN